MDGRTDTRLTAYRGPGDPAGYGDDFDFPSGGSEERGGGGLKRYLAAIRRYRWLIALSVLFGAGGSYGAWRLVQPSYVAQGSLWVNATSANEEQGPIAVPGLFEARSWIDLLTSFRVLDSVVTAEKLYLRPSNPGDLRLFENFELDERFLSGSYRLVVEPGNRASLTQDDRPIDQATAGEPIGEDVGFRWTLPEAMGPPREVDYSLVTPRDAAIQLRESLEPRMNLDGSFLSVELRGTDGERITRVLNAVLDRLVQVAAEIKKDELIARTNSTFSQLAEVESQLRTAEQELEEFRVSTITRPSDAASIQAGLIATTPPAYQNYFELREQSDSIRSEREQVDELLQHVAESNFSLDRIEAVSSAVSSIEMETAMVALSEARSERRDLLQRYTPDDPRVQDVTARVQELETEVIPTLLGQALSRLEAEERRLAQRVAAAGAELEEMPVNSIEESRLAREVAQSAEIYGDLQNRYEVARLAEATTLPDIQILDRATRPEVPANDQRIMFAGVAFMGFVALGVLVAIMLDRFDPRIRYPEEIEQRFGVPFLGVVPTIPKSNGSRATGAANQAYEAFRELRTNLTYAYGSAGPIVVAISSPGAGDGKSLLAANLALAFAHQGRHTLLVDADSRRGHLHRSFEVDRKPGLTDFLAQGGSVRDLVKGTKHANLDIVSAGSRLPNSPELIASAGMSEAMAEFKGGYDVIIVDTPPLAAGSDAILLSCLAGHLVLVLRSGSTEKDFASTKIEPIGRLPIRVLGVVLNDYDARGGGPYAYYGRYLPGYETGDEKAEPLRLPESTATLQE